MYLAYSADISVISHIDDVVNTGMRRELAQRREKASTRAFPGNTGSPEMLYLFVFTALSDAEAITLRLEML